MVSRKSAEQLGVANKNEAHYATQLAVWNALGQLDVNELKHENKNVEKQLRLLLVMLIIVKRLKMFYECDSC